MRFLIPALMLLMIAPAAAHAADPAAVEEKPASPCSHASGINILGVDLDSMRCQLAVALQAVEQQSRTLIGANANLAMTQSDLAAAQAAVDGLNKKLAEDEAKLAEVNKKAAGAQSDSEALRAKLALAKAEIKRLLDATWDAQKQ